MKRHTTVLGSVAVALFVGCAKNDEGGGGGGGDGGGSAGISLDDAPQEIARAVCPKAYTCCTSMQLMSNDLAGTDEPSCETATTQGFRNQLGGVRASMEKNRARYNGDKMATCLAYIRSATCDDLNRTYHFTGIGCDPWVEPLVPVGGACGQEHECIEGTCDKSAAPSGGDGVCRPLPTAGQACAGLRCAKGTECDGSTKTCMEVVPGRVMPKPDQCFYSSACSYGRAPAPAAAAVVVFVGLALLARRRRRVS
jgi:hypothetical protein